MTRPTRVSQTAPRKMWSTPTLPPLMVSLGYDTVEGAQSVARVDPRYVPGTTEHTKFTVPQQASIEPADPELEAARKRFPIGSRVRRTATDQESVVTHVDRWLGGLVKVWAVWPKTGRHETWLSASDAEPTPSPQLAYPASLVGKRVRMTEQRQQESGGVAIVGTAVSIDHSMPDAPGIVLTNGLVWLAFCDDGVTPAFEVVE